jgi:exopolysaccharide biosynthesis polyprenyl glycosylphosphotransferase
VTGSRLPVTEPRESTGPLRTIPRRSGSGRVIAYLPQYDVRVRRELAHRRFLVSMLRQVLRIVSLHALDAASVLGAIVVARGLTDVVSLGGAAPALIAFVLVGLNLRGSYRAGDARRDGQRLLSGALIGVALAALLPPPMRLPPQFLAIFGLGSIAALIIERRIVDVIVHQAYVRGLGLRRALIITRGNELEDVLSGIVPVAGSRRTAEDQVIVGYVSPDRYDSYALGSLNELEQILNANDISELLMATSLSDDTISEVSEICFERGVRVFVVPSALRTLRSGDSAWAELTQIGRSPAYHLHPARLELPALVLKRATDLLLATLGLIVALPLMLLIAVGIKLESRGPVFFLQRRVGLGGREFLMWKFRSMLHEAEAQQEDIAHLNAYGNGRLFKLRGDPRVTRIGRLLRRFSLDELPQVFNILAGQMSFVGPRPPLPGEVRHYETRHFVRLSVVPGLTGPWQVNGRNLITDFEEIVRLERAYIETWSLRSDIEIMLRTFAVVLEGKGAY